MQPTYFASFFLGTPDSQEYLGVLDVVPLLEQWVFQNIRRPIERPNDFDPLGDNNYAFPGEIAVHTRYVETRRDSVGGELFALRYEHLDAGPPPRRWRTDVVLDAENGCQFPTRCSISVYVANAYSSLSPIGSVESRPRIVPEIIKRLGAHENFLLLAEPMIMGEDEASILAQLLTSSRRTLPVILVTGKNNDNQPIFSPNHLADQLAGIAYVCVTKNKEVTYAIRDQIGALHYAYDGAVRLYWPNFAPSDDKFRHPLWVRSRVEMLEEQSGGFAKHVLKLLSQLSISRNISGIVRWEDVQKKRILLTSKENLKVDELQATLEEAWSKADILRTENEALSFRLLEKEEELEKKDQNIVYWRTEFLNSRRNAQSSRGNLEVTEIKSLGEAIKLATESYEDCLAIPNAAIRKDAYHFEEPHKIFTAFEWLATTYRAAKMGEAPGTNLDHSCREQVGFSFSANQSEITMSKAEGDYAITHGGQTYSLEEHIKKGTSTDPRHTIRIAFAFDEKKKIVVIGFIGQHQKTSKSN